jgi:photosystem II stability/assembly factor-like uncharacterized protein
MLRKRFALFAVSAVSVVLIGILLSGCQQQTGIVSVTSGTTSQTIHIRNNNSSTKGGAVPETISEDSSWYPLHRTTGENGEDIVFIDPQCGWKMVYGEILGNITSGSQDVVLYNTIDGGENWVQVSKTRNENSDSDKTIPYKGIKTGMTFLDKSTGWISFQYEAPASLLITHDGGHTWEKQSLPLMENSGLEGGLVLAPPTFLTKDDGIIVVNNCNSLFYITHDGGENWSYIEQPSRSGSSGNLSWDFSGTDRNYDLVMNGQVTVNETIWGTSDGGHTWTQVTDKTLSDTQPIRADVNNDGVVEDISLHTLTKKTDTGYSPSLYLVINGRMQLVFDDAFQGSRVTPEIHLLNSSDGKSKAVIVNSAIKTADWTPVEDYYVYQFKDGIIKNVPVIIPEQKFAVKGNKVQVMYPEFNVQKSFTVNDNTVKFYGEPKDIFVQGKNPLYLRGVLLVKGKEGLDRFITYENAELRSGGYFYTVDTWYEFKDDKLMAESVQFTDRR